MCINEWKADQLPSPPPKEKQDDASWYHSNILDPSIDTIPPLNQLQYWVGEPHCVKNIESFLLYFPKKQKNSSLSMSAGKVMLNALIKCRMFSKLKGHNV